MSGGRLTCLPAGLWRAGALYDDAVRAVYVPVPGQEGRVMTGVKYEDGGRVDIKASTASHRTIPFQPAILRSPFLTLPSARVMALQVLLTQPLSDELFADLLLVTPEGQSQKATRVQRK